MENKNSNIKKGFKGNQKRSNQLLFFLETISRCITKYIKRSYLEIIIGELIIDKFMPQNPFYLGWNKGWSFLFYLEGGTPKIEASGFGIAMSTDIKRGESPSQTADRLIFKEQRNRKSRYYSWIRSIKLRDNFN